MKSIALILAVFGSSVLLAEAITPDVHDPAYRKTTSFIEKGDYLDAPQQGTSAVHKHSDKAPHHDDSHSHEDSSEHRRHARDTEDGVESKRLGGSSFYQGNRPGSSGLGSGSHHSSSGFGSGSHHGSSGLGSGSLHGSSGLGSGSHHGSSGLGSGSHHGSSGFGSGSHRGSSGLGSGSLHTGSSGLGHSSGYHGSSSGLGSGSLHGSSSGHHRRPSSVRGGTISLTDDSVSMRKRSADETSSATPAVSVEGDTVRMTNEEHSCLLSNARDEVVENRRLECNGESCSLLEQSNRHTAWKCGQFKCNVLKFDIDKPLPTGLVFQCTEERSLINAPKRCPPGSKVDWAGKCRPEF